MRKRLVGLLVITPLLLSSQISTSHAATKAGAKCSKVGSKSVVGAKTFTCIKSGSKLVWDKGNTKPSSSSSFAKRWNATGSSAIKVMEKSELVAETLGEHVFDYFLRNKRSEWDEYRKQVTQWELDEYLLHF